MSLRSSSRGAPRRPWSRRQSTPDGGGGSLTNNAGRPDELGDLEVSHVRPMEAPSLDKQENSKWGTNSQLGPALASRVGAVHMRSECDNDLGGVANGARHLNRVARLLDSNNDVGGSSSSSNRLEPLNSSADYDDDNDYYYEGARRLSDKVCAASTSQRMPAIKSGSKTSSGLRSSLLVDNRRETRSRKFNSLASATKNNCSSGSNHSSVFQPKQLYKQVSLNNSECQEKQQQESKQQQSSWKNQQQQQERSSSVTSDYFSSSHNSPIVQAGRHQQQQQQQKRRLGGFGWSPESTSGASVGVVSPATAIESKKVIERGNGDSAATKTDLQQSSKATVIYENPLFVRDVYESSSSSQAAATIIMKAVPKLDEQRAPMAALATTTDNDKQQQNCRRQPIDGEQTIYRQEPASNEIKMLVTKATNQPNLRNRATCSASASNGNSNSNSNSDSNGERRIGISVNTNSNYSSASSSSSAASDEATKLAEAEAAAAAAAAAVATTKQRQKRTKGSSLTYECAATSSSSSSVSSIASSDSKGSRGGSTASAASPPSRHIHPAQRQQSMLSKQLQRQSADYQRHSNLSGAGAKLVAAGSTRAIQHKHRQEQQRDFSCALALAATTSESNGSGNHASASGCGDDDDAIDDNNSTEENDGAVARNANHVGCRRHRSDLSQPTTTTATATTNSSNPHNSNIATINNSHYQHSFQHTLASTFASETESDQQLALGALGQQGQQQWPAAATINSNNTTTVPNYSGSLLRRTTYSGKQHWQEAEAPELPALRQQQRNLSQRSKGQLMMQNEYLLQEEQRGSCSGANAVTGISSNYYYMAQIGNGNLSQQHHRQMLGSQASSGGQRTSETCDESPMTSSFNWRQQQQQQFNGVNGATQLPSANNGPDTDDYHYYQVVVPEQQQQKPTSTDLRAVPASPCKGLQRIVSSLFPNQQQSHQHQYQLPPVPTINQNLVPSEPLIRSSSWQNKTLIDLRPHQQHLQQQYQQQSGGLHYLESSLIKKTPPLGGQMSSSTATLRRLQFAAAAGGGIELSNIEQRGSKFTNEPPPPPASQPQARQEHLYCGVSTFRKEPNRSQQHQKPASADQQQQRLESPTLAHYKNETLNQSFHTLVDKMNENHFYQIQSVGLPGVGSHQHQPGSLMLPSRPPGYQFGTGKFGSGSSSDSALGKLGIRHCLSRAFRSNKLCYLLFILSAFACILLVALLSNYRSTGSTITTINLGADKDLMVNGFHTQSTNGLQMIGTNEFNNNNNNNHHHRHQLDSTSKLSASASQTPPGVGSSSPYSSFTTPSQYPQLSSQQQQLPASYMPHNHKQNPVILPILRGGSSESITEAPFSSTTRATTTTTTVEPIAASTQSYWLDPSSSFVESAANGNDKRCPVVGEYGERVCNNKGHCDDSICSCYPGFSGPSCEISNCPNECSQRGECRLRQDLPINHLGAGVTTQVNQNERRVGLASSIAFQTLSASKWRNSICPKKYEGELNQTWAIRGNGLRKQMAQLQSQQLLASYGDPTNMYLYDNRLEWHCVCQAGFTGSDCSRLRELHCDDEKDDDNDGLIDCEDDDCCSQPVCRENLMCFKSPEPTKILESLSASLLIDAQNVTANSSNNSGSNQTKSHAKAQRFYTQMRFLIGTDSVQSYAQERAFDKSRVAVIRGRVIKSLANQLAAGSFLPTTDTNWRQRGQEGDSLSADRGIVSVRVSVVETTTIGFTLTRNDGFFDMLVNGNEWITLQFHRNAYLPVQKKVFVKVNSINALDDDIVMWLANSNSQANGSNSSNSNSNNNGQSNNNINANSNSIQQHPTEDKRLDSSFNILFYAELYKFVSAYKRDDERRKNELFECLISNLYTRSTFRSQYEPALMMEAESRPTASSDEQKQQEQPLKTFVLSSAGAFQTQISGVDKSQGGRGVNRVIQLVYNSALFPPAASVSKPTISIELLPSTYKLSSPDHWIQQQRLIAVIVHLDIEGQSHRERLMPLPKLVYQFAWNRRNVYEQKVYGLGELSIRIGYEYELKSNKSTAAQWNECLISIDGLQQHQFLEAVGSGPDQKFKSAVLANANLERQIVWFERRVHLEAHHLNQHSDLGKWTLASSNRFDRDQGLAYLGTGWTLPYKLVYPPVISSSIYLQHQQPKRAESGDENSQQQQLLKPSLTAADGIPHATGARLMTRGPNSSMFLITLGVAQSAQAHRSSIGRLVHLDATGRRRLLDVPLSILSSKLGILTPSHTTVNSANLDEPQQQQRVNGAIDDIQLQYNNYLSTLYLSSRMAGKIMQVSYASLVVLNRTLAGGSPTAAAEDEIDIEPLCGFGRQFLTGSDFIRPARSVRLQGPHSMTLDEERQVLYFIDGPTNLMALDLSSRLATLLPAKEALRRPPATVPSSSPLPPTLDHCRRADMKIQFRDYTPQRMHSLTWVRAESALYFVDQNLIFALRQDFSLELVAAGATNSATSRPSLPVVSLLTPLACLPVATTSTPSPLGQIRSLALDEASNDLLIAHQWPMSMDSSAVATEPAAVASAAQDSQKLGARFYLAKVKLGLRNSGGGLSGPIAQRIIDLHSSSTYNSMILRLASGQRQLKTTSLAGANRLNSSSSQTVAISWPELAAPVQLEQPHGFQQQQSSFNSSGQSSAAAQAKRVPFINLSRGFKRIDSIEINSDGSIFVLDSSLQSLKLISAYSPNDFNLVERHDVNINRLFAQNGEPLSGLADSAGQLLLQNQQRASRMNADINDDFHGDDESRKLNVLLVQNPISGELMEFHSSSGLQLSLTSPANGMRFEFNYRLLTNNKMVELDEDDKYDFDAQRLIMDYVKSNDVSTSSNSDSDSINGNQKDQQLMLGAYVRLDKITEQLPSTNNKNKNEYELVRLYTGSRFVLQSILINQQAICEVASDYMGVLNTYQRPGENYWTEVIYDSKTYLLRDMIIKVESTQGISSNSDSNSSHKNNRNSNREPSTKDWKQLKRIVYDRIFYHYCDLFIIDV